MTSICALIPARGGSKGLPGKNIKPFCGKPLVAWSIEQALAAPEIGRVVVSTDAPAIAAVARQYGAEVPFMRPPELADDGATTESAMLHALDQLEAAGHLPNALMLLQPTSPVRRAGTLSRAAAEFEATRADSLVGVCEQHAFFWRNPEAPEASYDFHNRPRRQDIAPQDRHYVENGSVYMTRTSLLREHENRLCGRIHLFQMDRVEAQEIDDATDFAIVEVLMERLLSEQE